MPGINGVDVLKAIKQLDATITLLMITWNDDNGRGLQLCPEPFDLRYVDHLLAARAQSRGGRTG